MKTALLISFLILVALISCDDFLEKNISEENVVLKSPVKGFETTDTVINFKWEGIDGAKWYEFELITPSFDSVYMYVADSILEVQELTLILPAQRYGWRVKAVNNSFETNFTSDSFCIIGIPVFDINKISVQLQSPLNNYLSNENFVEFAWDKIEDVAKYSFVIKKNSWVDSIYYSETTSKNSSKLLLNDGIYYWGVAAIDSDKTPSVQGDYSTNSLIVNYLPPEVPRTISPTSSDTIKSHHVKFAWNSVEDSSSYNLTIFKNSILTDVYSDTWITDTVQSVFINYDGNIYWKMRAKDKYGKIGAYTPVNNFIIETDKDIRDNVVNILAPQQNAVLIDSSITFWWDVIGGATLYELQIVTPNFNSAQKLIENVVIESNTYKTKLQAGSYQWRVKAFNPEFETSYSYGVFTVYQSSIENKSVNLILPDNNDLFNSRTINFSWESIPNCSYILLVKSEDWESGAIIKNIELTNSTFEMSLNAGSYFWGVEAVDSRNGVKTDFTVRKFHIDLTKPDIPTPVAPVNNFETLEKQVEFSWDDQGDDISFYTFELYKHTNVLTLVSTQTLSYKSLLYNFDEIGNYSWRVKAIDQANNESHFSSFMTLSILGETNISSELVNLLSPSNGSSFTTQSINLWWDDIEDAKEYKLQVVSPSFSNSQKLIISTLLEETNYQLDLSGGKYEWRVKALNSISETAYTTGNFVVQDIDVSNEFVELVSPANNLLSNLPKINFTWRKVNDYCSYNIIVKKDSWDNGSIIEQFTVSDTSKVVSLNDGIYYWGIRAISSDKSETDFSVRSFTIDTSSPLVPEIVSPVNHFETNGENLQFSWLAGSSDDQNLVYTVEIFRIEYGKNNQIFTYTTSQNQMIYTISLSGDYFWRIKAVDKAGNSSDFSQNYFFTVIEDVDLSSLNLVLLSPANNLFSDLTEVTFWWQKIDGADQYVFQLIRPDFTYPEELISDEEISENKITISLSKRGSYQWKVKAINSTSETKYTTRTITLY